MKYRNITREIRKLLGCDCNAENGGCAAAMPEKVLIVKMKKLYQ